MYSTKKEIFSYHEPINPNCLKNPRIIKPLKEKIKNIILDYPYGGIYLMNNCFRKESNTAHNNLCNILKEKFKRNNINYEEKPLFYFQPYNSYPKRNPYCIVEPDFLIGNGEPYDIIEVKSSNNECNIEKGISQLLLSDFLLNNFMNKDEEGVYSRNLYLVVKRKGNNGDFVPYRIGDNIKSGFYNIMKSFFIDLLNKKIRSEQRKVINYLIETLSIVKERI